MGRFCGALLWLTAALAVGIGCFGGRFSARLLRRESNATCLPPGFRSEDGGPQRIELEPAVRRHFERDGAVIMRGALSPAWVARMRETVVDSFAHPTFWDKLYTTGLASFFCAQKTVMLPMTSTCGQHMARFSPLAHYAAQLLGSPTVRVAEPSEGMGSFAAEKGRRRPKDGAGHENCGHTAYHRDDSYFPIRARGGSGVAVVRFWIPLDDMPLGTHTMTFVNGSHRTRGSDSLSSTQFATTAQQDASKLPLLQWHAKLGDVIAFAGESVHNAATQNCSSCLRLILGFAGENAVFDATVPSPLMPLADGQTHGAALHGPAFPLVLDDSAESSGHHIPADWEPMAPSALEIASVAKDSLVQGMKGFEGSWFSGCTRQFDVGPFFTVPPICGEEPLSPEADFWDTVNRVFYRAPLLAGQWQYPPGRSPQ